MAGKAFRVCAPAVVSEVIDGEAIIMDLRSGNYFSADGAGARLWEVVTGGCGPEALKAWAHASFDGSADEIASGVDAFVRQLLDNGLIEVWDAEVSAPGPVAQRQPFGRPELCVYTDMQDLLLLDPIHDVDEAGWPVRKTDKSQV